MNNKFSRLTSIILSLLFVLACSAWVIPGFLNKDETKIEDVSADEQTSEVEEVSMEEQTSEIEEEYEEQLSNSDFRLVKVVTEVKGKYESTQTYKYNEKGLLTESETVYGSGTVVTDKYTYDETGRLIDKYTKNIPSDDQEEPYYDEFIFEYDKDGKLIKYKIENDNDYLVPGTDNYEYGSNGKVSHISWKEGFPGYSEYTYHDNGLFSKYIYKTLNHYCIRYFDEEGRIIKMESYSEDDKGNKEYEEIVLYKYEKDGSIVETKTLPEEESTVYILDNFGHLIEKNDETRTYKFDENNNLIEEQSRDEYVYYYKYDKHGNLISEEAIYEDGETNKTEYEYDKYGNLIKETGYDYSGDAQTVTYTYENIGIEKVEINDGVYASLSQNEYKYDGKEKKPFVSMIDPEGIHNYTQDVDYEVIYVDNKEIGDAKAIIKFFKTTSPYEVEPAPSFTLNFKITE